MGARIAFSGSGSLAGIHAGAYKAICESFGTVDEVAGTSGGSIAAACVAVGMNPDQLRDVAVNSDMSRLLGINSIKSDLELITSDYLDSGVTLFDWLDQVLGGKTFAQTTVPVQIVATDLAAKHAFVFSRSLTPNVKLAFACRASAAIPIVYAPVSYADPITGRMMMLVDGGLVDNLPGSLLAQDGKRFAIDVVDASGMQDISTRVSRLKAYVRCMLAANEDAQMALCQALGTTLVRVPTDQDPLNFSLPQTVRQSLFDAGYAATRAAIVK